jgi:hypothetical protein
MANPTTVLQFVTLQKSALVTAQTNAQTGLTAKQAAYAAAVQARNNAKTALAATAADMTSLRNQMATAETPEDIAVLLRSLQADITTARRQTGALATAERAAAAAKADVDGAAAEVQRVSAALKAAAAALVDAITQDKRRTALKTALAASPLSTIVADAASVLAGTAFVDPAGLFKYTDARNRLQGDIPTPLITEAAARLQDEIARATASSGEFLQAQQLVEAKWTSDGGVNGSVAALQNVFTRADAAFSAYITTANDQFQRAKTALARAADPTVSPLTVAQKAAINDATTVANAQAAALLEKPVADAAALVSQKQAILDEKIREAMGNDVADPSTDAAVIAATTNLNTAKTALTNAQAAYTAALQAETVAWEVLVPDAEWQLLAGYQQATNTLNWLQTPGPTVLLNAMNAAEGALVTALLAADKSTRTQAELRAAAAKWSAVADYESAAADGRQFSALRGDF